MRGHSLVTLLLTWCLVTGCQEDAAPSKPEENVDVALVNTLNNIGVENAIIAQHTLYPYHFGVNAAELNDLGKRDLAVLARHFAQHPGVLNVQRGDVAEDLYQRRTAEVMSGLKAAGVGTSRMRISEGMPGGSGMPSEHVVVILQTAPKDVTSSRSSGLGRITDESMP